MGQLGKVEHEVVSFVKGIIPETVQNKWHEYWASMKQAETETLGGDEISSKVEMANWGVQEASERNLEEASKSIFVPCSSYVGNRRRGGIMEDHG